MMQTKIQYDKINGILGFTLFNLLKKMAQLIEIKLVEEMWKNKFGIAVTTHQNNNHIHYHFIINSVSFKYGKKYSDNRESYVRLRHLLDYIS